MEERREMNLRRKKDQQVSVRLSSFPTSIAVANLVLQMKSQANWSCYLSPAVGCVRLVALIIL